LGLLPVFLSQPAIKVQWRWNVKTYDDAGRLLRIANVIPGVATISSFGYGYDPAGNRTRVIEANGDRVTWSYDNLYQLIHERRSGANNYDVTYAYDSSGNRIKKIQNTGTTTVIYDAANQLVKQKLPDGTITTYTFDAAGNQQRATAAVLTTYSWDFENQLTKIRQGNPTPLINTMIYDGLGNKVRKEDSSGVAKLIWDHANILLETDQNDATQAMYTMQPALFGNLISQIRGTITNFYNFDGIGSTDRLTDSTGQNVTDSFIYKAFGELQSRTGSTVNLSISFCSSSFRKSL
jgi:YD repeat-containing protein